MTVRFFVRESGGTDSGGTTLSPDFTLTAWSPRNQRTLPLDPADPLRTLAWLQDRCRLFADGRYTELSLWRGERRVHRLIVTPRWYRFPFMEPGDLQLGALWTDPPSRRQGLARAAMAEAHRLFAGDAQRFWFVTDRANAASTALAHAAGYRLAGTGQRTSPIGIALLGQFRLDRPEGARGPIPG